MKNRWRDNGMTLELIASVILVLVMNLVMKRENMDTK